MRLQLLKNLNEIKNIAPDSIGKKIMIEKAGMLFFKIEKLHRVGVNILKQDALSLGADLVTPREAILGESESYDCILIGNIKSIKILSKKLMMQPFGLKELGRDLRVFLRGLNIEKGTFRQSLESENSKEALDSINNLKYNSYNQILQNTLSHKLTIMAIVNINSNSFYTEFKNDSEAINHIYELMKNNVDIIDIGAVSSRPGSPKIGADIELKRLKNIFNEIRSNNLKAIFSIDTYNPIVASEAIEASFSIINDISGNIEGFIPLLKENNNIYYVLTHIVGNPQDMQQYCNYDNVVLDIDSYFESRLEALACLNIKNVILDVGIGFAKNTLQNIELIKHLRHFKRFSKPLLVGLSNKSMIKSILSSENIDLNIANLNIASLIAGIEAFRNGADILRVHSLNEYKIALSILKTLD